MHDHYAVVDIGDGIFLSHRDKCPSFPYRERIIHIWRSDMPENSCVDILNGNAKGLVIHYKDGEPLVNASVDVQTIVDFCAQPPSEPLLIHCTVGQTRGPTIALLAKIARGSTPFAAMGTIAEVSWRVRRVIPNFCLAPLKEIFEWWEEHQ